VVVRARGRQLWACLASARDRALSGARALADAFVEGWRALAS
jgi:hypothetical protein